MAGDAKALYRDARAAWEDGSLDRAEESYRLAIDADPSFPLPYFDLGMLIDDDDETPSLLAHFIGLAAGDGRLAGLVAEAGRRLANGAGDDGRGDWVPRCVLGAPGPALIQAIKIIRDVSGLGLKEAKHLGDLAAAGFAILISTDDVAEAVAELRRRSNVEVVDLPIDPVEGVDFLRYTSRRLVKPNAMRAALRAIREDLGHEWVQTNDVVIEYVGVIGGRETYRIHRR